MKKISKLGAVLTGILEIFHWVGAALMTAAAVCSVAAPRWVGCFVGFEAKDCCGTALNVYGFEVVAPVVDGAVNMCAFLVFAIGAVIILGLMAMVFRDLHLIFRRSGETTPFQQENIRRLKEIGILSIAVPLVGLVMSIIARIVIGPEAAETSVNQGGIFMGVIVLCLTRYFIHGAELEQDVDGLL
ncbi:MAG: hypothetical protein IJ357_08035 [Oscillospiraceae bacterium]|nr:hypothetical protein [Oscillospiraceae bacterium]